MNAVAQSEVDAARMDVQCSPSSLSGVIVQVEHQARLLHESVVSVFEDIKQGINVDCFVLKRGELLLMPPKSYYTTVANGCNILLAIAVTPNRISRGRSARRGKVSFGE